MEIDPNEKSLKSAYPEKNSKIENPSATTFGTILEDLIDDPKKVNEESENTPAINHVSEMQLSVFLSGGQMPVIDRAERLLNTLDNYQQKLANPNFTLRDISPLVDQLKADNESLASAVSSLADGDKLKNILNQVIATSSVEIIKFNRGDYVNS